MNKVSSKVEKVMIWSLVIIFMLSLLLVLNPKINTNDAIGYYAQTVSIVNDGNLDLKQEITHYNKKSLENNLQFDPNTQIYYSQYPIGVSLFQVPVLAVVKVVSGKNYRPYSLKTTRVINFIAALLGGLALWLLWVPMSKLMGKMASLSMLILLLLASSTYFYVFIQGSYSHVYSFFLCALFVYLFLNPIISKTGELDFALARKRSWANHILLGVSLGLLAITRYLDGLLVLTLIFEFIFISRIEKRISWATFRPYLLSALAFIAILSIQMGIQYWQHDSWNVLDYYDGKFKGEGMLSNWPRLLFSSYHGLFYWHPILMLGLLGWIGMLRTKNASWRLLGMMFLVILFILSLVTSAWGKFAFGASSFGHRFFISIYPFFAVGIAFFIRKLVNSKYFDQARMRWLFSSLGLFLIVWNFGLIYQLVTGMIPSDAPVSWLEMAKNNFYSIPKELLGLIGLS